MLPAHLLVKVNPALAPAGMRRSFISWDRLAYVMDWSALRRSSYRGHNSVKHQETTGLARRNNVILASLLVQSSLRW